MHETFDDVEAALTAMKRETQIIRQEGPLEEISAIRDYEPGQLIHARLELSSAGLLGHRLAGMDLMGDGTLVPYVGVIRKRALDMGDSESPFDAIRQELS
jgi:hypothetical protein